MYLHTLVSYEHCTFAQCKITSQSYLTLSPSSHAVGDRPQMPLPHHQPGTVVGPAHLSGHPESPMLSPSHLRGGGGGSKSTTLPPSARYQGLPSSPSRISKKTGRGASPTTRASYTHEYTISTPPLLQQTNSQRKRAESVDTSAYTKIKY